MMRSIHFLALVFALAPCVAGKRLRESGQDQLASSQGVVRTTAGGNAYEEQICKACDFSGDGRYCNEDTKSVMGECVPDLESCGGNTMGDDEYCGMAGELPSGHPSLVPPDVVVEVALTFKDSASWKDFFRLEHTAREASKRAGAGSLADAMTQMAGYPFSTRVAKTYQFVKDETLDVTIRETYKTAAQEVEHRKAEGFKAYAALKGAYHPIVAGELIIDAKNLLKNFPKLSAGKDYPFSAYPAAKVWKLKDGEYEGGARDKPTEPVPDWANVSK